MIEENRRGNLVEIKKILPYTPFQDEIVFVDGAHTFKIEAWRIEYYKDMLSEKLKLNDNYTGSYVELILEILKTPELWEGFSEEEVQEIKSSIICPFDFREYIVDWTQRDIRPSLFVLESVVDFKYIFRQYEIDDNGLFNSISEILQSVKQHDYEESLTYDSEESDIEALQTKMKRLEEIIFACKVKMRELGVPSDVLENIIRGKHETPELFISLKNKILINNQEVHLAPLDKAVYLLYLNHPEGINFSYLPDYREELLGIYRKLMNYRTSAAMIKSVEDVTDSTQNSINEKCARIRRAFVAILGKYWAEPYCITGKRGEVKKITLNRSLVVKEENLIRAKREEQERLRKEMHSSYIEKVSPRTIKWAIENSIPLNEFDFVHKIWNFRRYNIGRSWCFEFSENKIQCQGQQIGTYKEGDVFSPMTLTIDQNGTYKLISILPVNSYDYRAVFLSEDGAHVISPTINPKMLSWTLEEEMKRTIELEERQSIERPVSTEHIPNPFEHHDIDGNPENLPF